MKYYLFDGTFNENRPQGPDFKAALDAHHQYTGELLAKGQILVGGPKMAGSGFFIVKCEDDAAAEKIAAEDPFVIRGVQTYKISEFKMVLGDESVKEWFK